MKRGRQPPAYYPISLNINGRRCIVVGGGEVALRKVGTLLKHGASVKVISPDLCPELNQLAKDGQIGVLQRSYQVGDLHSAFLAIIATSDRQTNIDAVKESRNSGVLVNVVDDAENSDFIVPSYMRRGDITIAVSTGGRSPALARKIRTRLEKDFGGEYASLALLIDEVRTEVKQQGIKVNGNIWQEALDLDLMIDLLKEGDSEKARAILLSNLKIRQK